MDTHATFQPILAVFSSNKDVKFQKFSNYFRCDFFLAMSSKYTKINFLQLFLLIGNLKFQVMSFKINLNSQV